MGNYQTPGVYIEETNNLPMSIVAAPATVPAFIGKTAQQPTAYNGPVKIHSLAEYINLFGQADEQQMTFTASKNEDDRYTVSLDADQALRPHLYYHMQLYFANGGGDCFISVVQNDESGYVNALNALETKDEISLIVLTDAPNDNKQAALTQCQALNRFVLLDSDYDTPEGETKTFRDDIGQNNLQYAAAYTPYLNTSLRYHYSKYSLQVSAEGYIPADLKVCADTTNGLSFYIENPDIKKVTINTSDAEHCDVTFEIESLQTIKITAAPSCTKQQLVAGWNSLSDQDKGEGLESLVIQVDDADNASKPIESLAEGAVKSMSAGEPFPLFYIKTIDTGLYNQIKDLANKQRVSNLPPSAAMAGLYCKQERERGIWQSPANISLNGVIAPAADITQAQQEDLNIDPTSGKSINAIRQFPGKGTLVWGARTLAGNDNNWRYICVRRTFSYVERSIKTALQSYVFEPNTAMTWLKINTMITSFLTDLWQQGGLAGSTDKDAFFVNIGLGKTMSSEDILEGRLKVSIGLAAVRPAEFIVVEFSQLLQK